MKKLLLLLALGAGLFLVSRVALGKSGNPLLSLGIGVTGLKNNNPGNIRHSNDQWQGMSPQQTDPNFVQFVTPDDGVRALARNLKTYFSQGINTIARIITTWAPPTENNTDAYIQHVSQVVGVNPNQVLTPDLGTLVALTNAIILHENGQNPYSPLMVTTNVSRA